MSGFQFWSRLFYSVLPNYPGEMYKSATGLGEGKMNANKHEEGWTVLAQETTLVTDYRTRDRD